MFRHQESPEHLYFAECYIVFKRTSRRLKGAATCILRFDDIILNIKLKLVGPAVRVITGGGWGYPVVSFTKTCVEPGSQTSRE